MRSKQELFSEVRRLRNAEERETWVEELALEETEAVMELAQELAQGIGVAMAKIVVVLDERLTPVRNALAISLDDLPDEWKGEDTEDYGETD